VFHACSRAGYRTRSGDDHEPDTAASKGRAVNKPCVSGVVACERHFAVPLNAPVVALLD
jgi:hypothetical protein